MTKEEKERKIKELRFELIKSNSSKTGNSKIKEIKKIMARIFTLDTLKDKNGNMPKMRPA